MNKMLLFVGIVCLPLRQLSVSSPFGYRIHPLTGCYTMHAGVDLCAHYDAVYAVMDNHVTAAGYDPALGVYIKINNGPFCATYGHLSALFVNKGDTVDVGTPLGISGATGRVDGPHLHFSIQYRGRYIDPLEFLYSILKKQNN